MKRDDAIDALPLRPRIDNYGFFTVFTGHHITVFVTAINNSIYKRQRSLRRIEIKLMTNSQSQNH